MRDALGGPGDAEPSTFTGGAALQSGDTAWVLIDDQPLRAVGRALAWAYGRDVATVNLLVDNEAGAVTRRASQFKNSPIVWLVQGRDAHRVEPEPVAPAIEPPAEALAAAHLLTDAGADVVIEHGVVKGEVLGLEIATIVVDDNGAHVDVGVGRHDREAFAIIHGDVPPAAAVAAVVSEVRLRRRADAALDHPLKRLVPERWLREIVIASPDMVNAASLERIEGPVRRDSVKDVLSAFAAGPGVVVACSVGIDLDLVPTAADARLAADPDARLVLVLPERDDHPVTRELAGALKAPAEIVTVSGDWRAGSAVA